MPSSTPASKKTPIAFTAEIESLGGTTLLRLTREASLGLPSRGQVAVHATIDGHEVNTVVEPDGRRGHWIRVDEALQSGSGLADGETASVTLSVADGWPEPEVPDDFASALGEASEPIRNLWDDITPMARWEWVRWVGATSNPQTRQRRVEVSMSKMAAGSRRPCCFDLASCTDPDVARSGKLPEPA